MMRLAMAEVQEKVVKRCLEEGIWCWPLMTVHDELILEVQEDYGEWARDEVVSVFENVMTDRKSGERLFRVPVKANGVVMQRWEK